MLSMGILAKIHGHILKNFSVDSVLSISGPKAEKLNTEDTEKKGEHGEC